MGYAWTEPYTLTHYYPSQSPRAQTARKLAVWALGLSPLLVARRYYEWVFPPLIEHGPIAHSHDLEHLLNIWGDQCDIKQTNKQTNKQNNKRCWTEP